MHIDELASFGYFQRLNSQVSTNFPYAVPKASKAISHCIDDYRLEAVVLRSTHKTERNSSRHSREVPPKLQSYTQPSFTAAYNMGCLSQHISNGVDMCLSWKLLNVVKSIESTTCSAT